MGWLIAVGVIAFLLSTPLFARDSRDGLDWRPRRWPSGTRPPESRRPTSSLSPRRR